MTFGNITKNQWHRVFDDDELIRCGSIISSEHEELAYVRPYVYIHGAISGSEKIRVCIYSDYDYTSLLYASDWSNLSDIENISAYWQGFVRCDFHREHLFSGNEYFVAIEINDYSRSDFTFFVSVKFDFDNSIYPIAGKDQIFSYPLAMEFFTYREFRE